MKLGALLRTRLPAKAFFLTFFCLYLRIAQTNAKCEPVSGRRLQSVARNNTLLVTVVDNMLWDFFGPSWVSSVKSAAISYWVIAAMGEDAAAAVEANGYGDRCVLFPRPANGSAEATGRASRKHRRRGSGGGRSTHSGYQWQSDAWKVATWVKVTAVTSLVDLGFDVVHSDVDVTWFQDALPLFLGLGFGEPPLGAKTATMGTREGWLETAAPTGLTALFSTDLLTTNNPATGGQDSGLESACRPAYSLNTGVYWVSGSEAGARLMHGWLAMKAAGDFPGDDQLGLNVLVRGMAMPLTAVKLPRGYDWNAASTNSQRQQRAATAPSADPPERLLGVPMQRPGAQRYTYYAAGAPGVPGADAEGVVVSCLPVSSFSHTYAFATMGLHQIRRHPLYEVHWVWGGKSLESKRQCMRDATVFADPPHYYRPQRIMTFELRHMEMPDGYNEWPTSRTPEMVTFAVAALSAQLQQAYWALAMAMALNRTLVLPRFRCYCAKNWYATTACRINHERDTVFPFACPLSHVFRAKLLLSGELRVADARPHPRLEAIGPGKGWRVAEVREPTFLSNPRTDKELRTTRSTVVRVRDSGGKYPDRGSSSISNSSNDVLPMEMVLDGAHTDRELQDMLLAPPYGSLRVLHVPQPETVLSGFTDALMWQEYDTAIQRVTATWCCWSTLDMRARGGTRYERLQPLPRARQQQQQDAYNTSDGSIRSQQQ